MTGRAFLISLRRLGAGWRPLMLMGVLALMGWIMPSRNPWNMIANGTSNSGVAELLIPGYLFLLVRDLRHPWEALVGIRLGSHRIWWVGQILAAGAVAVVLVAAMVAMFCALAVARHNWVWHWNAGSVQLVGGHVVAASPPWSWSLDALCLVMAGLWATGALWTLGALWWRSGWIAWVVVVGLSLLPLAFILTRANFMVWLLPGPQFAWTQHGSAFPHSPSPLWTFGYAAVLLGATTLAGGWLLRQSPWDARHGGPMG